MRWLALGFVTVVPLSCGLLETGLDCTADSVAGIRVFVVDSVTGAPRATEAIIYARSGSFVDSVIGRNLAPPGVEFSAVTLANDRAGVYEVSVRREGYAQWSKAGVRVVNRDQCHVATTELTAKLQAR
jgi:hypothetical protein